MAWFDHPYEYTQSTLSIAHISDSHLFADIAGEYFAVNTAVHLQRVLADIAERQLDGVIFGGDLTQDHSIESYRLFAKLVAQSAVTCPVFWLPGNHDEIALLNQISQGQIHSAKLIQAPGLQLVLLNSKGPTPAGWVDDLQLAQLKGLDATVPSVVFCHHNPLPVKGYIDKHMLENGPQLLNTLVDHTQTIALFHGHVHQQYHHKFRALDVYATPATSVQFKKHTTDWQQQNLGAGYRLISLDSAKNNVILDTKVIWLNE